AEGVVGGVLERGPGRGSFFFQAEDGIRDFHVTGVQTCALPISLPRLSAAAVTKLVEAAELSGRVLGVRMPVDDEQADEPWKMSPSRRSTARRLDRLERHVGAICRQVASAARRKERRAGG